MMSKINNGIKISSLFNFLVKYVSMCLLSSGFQFHMNR